MKTYYRKSTGPGSINGVQEVSMTEELRAQLPNDMFLSATSKDVKAFLAAQAEATKPQEVTMRQARLALLEAGLLDNVQNIVAGMQGVEGAAARIEWEYSSTMVRSQPLVAALAAALKLTSADVDALFLSSSTK
jgi:hypothetical protein